MAQSDRPNFQFYQAPPGPDSSRQYSDWTSAILAQGEAISKPLLMLMQNLADKQAQERHITAQAAAEGRARDYQKSRDVVHDAQFQQEQGLRESSETRQIHKEQYGQAQDTANVDLLMSLMAPKTSVEAPSPEYQALQGMRASQPMTPFSPLGGVAPNASVIDDAIRTQERRRESDQKQAALDQQNKMEGEYVQHSIDAGYVGKPDVPRVQMLMGQGAQGRAEAHKIIEQGRSDQDTVAERKNAVKDLIAHWDAHPEDPNSQKHMLARPMLESLSKTAKFPTLWDGLYKEAADATYGLGKQPAAKTPTMQIGDAKFDVPPYVVAGGEAKGALPANVENWIKDTAFSLAQKDKRMEGLSGEAMRGSPGEMQKLFDEKAQAVRQRVQDQYPWKVKPISSTGGMSSISQEVNHDQVTQAPTQASPSDLEGLTAAHMAEVKRIAAEQGDDAAMKYLMGIGTEGSVIAPPKSKPAPTRREREASRGPF